MRAQLGGELVLVVVGLLFIRELILQVSLEAKLFRTLSPDVRARFPPHPRNPFLIFAGSAKFQWSLWRYLKETVPSDPPDVARIKTRLYRSVRRATGWLALAILAVAALWVTGEWRPT